jgi:cationic peptide transport system permease protein
MVLIPQFIHVTRNAVKEEFNKDYVLASKLDGASSFRVLHYSVFPNIIEKIMNQATLAQSAAILDIAALGFLGLGAQIPLPEWGAILAIGIDLFYIAPWTVYLPGLAILFAVIVTNLVGEGIRHALKLRKES